MARVSEKQIIAFIIAAVLFTGCTQALGTHSQKDENNTWYVATNGNDANPGTLAKPFRSIQRAASRMKAGDICYLRAGRYHEQVIMKDVHGQSDKPIIFTSYKNEKVILDGTVQIRSKWTKHKDHIYKTQVDNPIWQLFVNGKSVCSARWPNGNWDDGSIWDKSKSMAWPEKKKSHFGMHYNSGLQELDGSLVGAMIIINSGSFKTYASRVTQHIPGTAYFSYDHSRVKRHFGTYPVEKHGYFLEGQLGLLDVPGEWHFDSENKTIYLWPPDNRNPDDLEVCGKVQSYAFEGSSSSYILLKRLDFFGTTFKFEDCHHVTVQDCDFLYPSYSKRMLGDLETFDVTTMITSREYTPAYNKVVNCLFEYMDGPAIKMTGLGNVIENCYVHDVDYSCTYEGGWTINTVDAPELLFRRNTVHTTGASELFKSGARNIIELNDLSRSGFLQNDGSLIQVSVKSQNGTVVRYNWVHDGVKQGIRFDNSNKPGSRWGEGGRVHHNVAWKTDRIYFKGDKHFIHNNLSFDSKLNDLIISSELEINGRNYETITRNNIAGTFSGNRKKPGKDYPVPGIVDHNWTADIKKRDIGTQLRDSDNLDFRPRIGSELIDAGDFLEGYNFPYQGEKPDIGPYEYGDLNYWIPGCRAEKASRPIPPDGNNTIRVDADLMWLQAYRSKSNHVYFGESRQRIKEADKSDKEYQGVQKNNIYTPKGLKSNKVYYWRIDAEVDGELRKGDIWSFTTNKTM